MVVDFSIIHWPSTTFCDVSPPARRRAPAASAAAFSTLHVTSSTTVLRHAARLSALSAKTARELALLVNPARGGLCAALLPVLRTILGEDSERGRSGPAIVAMGEFS